MKVKVTNLLAGYAILQGTWRAFRFAVRVAYTPTFAERVRAMGETVNAGVPR